jgi:predicted glycoside hydrolase/deacetylase ChbG (UPF0249 family)
MLTPNPLLARLGFPADARLVILHVDDAGMCHGSNRAYLDLLDAGMVKTGSIMAPCPWAHELLTICSQRPELDIGVHLTLNSEWSGYRWGPVSTRDEESGLIDATGCFWPNVAATAANLNPAAALAELRAQIELVRAAGVRFTHLDNHMGATLLPDLFSAYVELGFAYGVPVLLTRQLDDYSRGFSMPGMDDSAWSRYVAGLEERGMPLVDTFRVTPGYHGADAEGGRAELYERILHELPVGVTYFSVHPNAPGDIEVIDPPHAHWRTFEYQYLQSERLAAFLEREDIVPIGFEEIREVMRPA